MSFVINSSIPVLRSQFDARDAQKGIESSMNALSSGRRVNRAADDAAGMSISTRLETQQRALRQVIENAYRGANLVETAEGALGELEEGVQHVRELSLRALNSPLSSEDLSSIQAEITQTIRSMEQIADNATYNSMPLLSGSEADLAFEFPLTISSDSDDALQVQLPNMTSVEMGIAGGIDNGLVINNDTETQATLTTSKTDSGFQIEVGGTVSEGDVFILTANGRVVQHEATADDIQADNPRRNVVSGLIRALTEIFPEAVAYSEATKSVVAQNNSPQTYVGAVDGVNETQRIQMPFGFKSVGQTTEIYRRQIFNNDDISMLADGSYFIAYKDFDDGSNKIQKFDAAGNKLGPELRLGAGRLIDIEAGNDGGYAIGINNKSNEAREVLFYDSEGSLINTQQLIDTTDRSFGLSSFNNMYSVVSVRANRNADGLFGGSSGYFGDADSFTLTLDVFSSHGEPLMQGFDLDTGYAPDVTFRSGMLRYSTSMITEDGRVAVLWQSDVNDADSGPLKLQLVDIENPAEISQAITIDDRVQNNGIRLMQIDGSRFGVLWASEATDYRPVLQIYDLATDTLGSMINLEYEYGTFDWGVQLGRYINAEMVNDQLFYLDDSSHLSLFSLDGTVQASMEKLGYGDYLAYQDPNSPPIEQSDSFAPGRIAYIYPGVYGGDGILHSEQLIVEPVLPAGSYSLDLGSVTLVGEIPENSTSPFTDLVQSFQSDPSFGSAGVQLSTSESGIEVTFNDPGDRELVVFESIDGEAVGEVIEEVRGVSSGDIVLDVSDLALQNNRYTLTAGSTTLSANDADYVDDLDGLYADLVSDPDYPNAGFTLSIANGKLVVSPQGSISADSVQLTNSAAAQLDMSSYELAHEPQLLTIGEQSLEISFDETQAPTLDHLVEQIRSHLDFDQSRLNVFTSGDNLSIEFLDGTPLPVELSNQGLPLTANGFVVEDLPSGVGVNVMTREGAAIAIELTDAALARISRSRSSLGAVLNRIDHSINSKSVTQMNLQIANSRIVDADFAKQSASLAQYQIQKQVSQAMIAQANATHRAVMEILKPILG